MSRVFAAGSGEHGQALVFAVPALAIATLAVVGLAATGERIVASVRDLRAGEAAVAAAGAAVADIQLARVREIGRRMDASETASFVGSEAVGAAARESAALMARMHGGPGPVEVTVRSFGIEIEVHLTLGGHRHIALLVPPP